MRLIFVRYSFELVAAQLVLLTYSPAAFAQNPRDIVVRSLKAEAAIADVAAQYTYKERQVLKDLDAAGKVRKTTVETREILFLGGKRYERLLEKDDKPLPEGEARKEQARIDKATVEASRLTPEQRQQRFQDFKKQRAKQREGLQDIPDAYDFILLGQPVLNGRACFLIQAQPRSSYRGKNSNLLKRITGKLWIDRTDYAWVRVEADILDDVSFGLFLAKLSKGANFTLERVRINNEIWLPKELSARASARALIKTFHFDQSITYSEYRKFSTDSRIVDTAEPPQEQQHQHAP